MNMNTIPTPLVSVAQTTLLTVPETQTTPLSHITRALVARTKGLCRNAMTEDVPLAAQVALASHDPITWHQ